jgi:hypothetical protein
MTAIQNQSVSRSQDEIPTVRPPRSERSPGDDSPDDVRPEPLPPSLWQLAREVMLAEADEAMWKK